MVSAFQDEIRGFGFPITAQELQDFNSSLSRVGKVPLVSSPGLRFLQYGSNKEGWWDYEKFSLQVSDLLDVFEFLYSNIQLVLEVDHSSGHAKQKEDGLNVKSMNAGFGGTQKTPHTSVITPECLGPLEARMLWKGVEVDCKLKPGDIHPIDGFRSQ
eukprot:Pompholyxophrys_punicea_v1_NODE_393_length_2064_cov_23.574415.p2 type:complete len:157 gc:universal NODE_393_length_2064_cov_23.574415:1787-1317(-)